MMLDTGRILSVNLMPLGDELDVDAPAGVTTLTVTDAADFSEDGGFLLVGDSVYTYLTVDDTTGVITLSAPLVAPAYEGDPVSIYDTDTAAASVEMVAMVQVEGETDNDDALEALVPHTLMPYMPEGIRENGGEYVTLEWRGDDVYILDVLHREPVLDPSYVPTPSVETGNSVYRGDLPPWNDGDTAHADDDGDLWYATSTVTNEDGSTSQRMTPYLWDGTALAWVDASDPQVDLISSEVDSNNETLSTLTGRVDAASATATDARNLANTADGRVSFSDYDPSPDDTTYYAEDAEGNVLLDANGNPILMTRNPGSVWFTRTRARDNLVTNPSAEVDATGWAATDATIARAAVTTDPDVGGTHALRVTNSATTGGAYRVTWSATFAVLPGQSYAATAHATVETGSGLGAYAHFTFLDAADVLVSEVTGQTTDLTPEAWREVGIAANVPDGATKMRVEWHNPNPGAVWLLDGALVEASEYTGRYFDGDSEAASWDGTPHASTSSLLGGLITDVYELYDNGWVRMDFTGTTQYDADAGDLTKGTLNPARIADESLGIEKQKTNRVRASEALSQGDIVNIWDNNGLFFVRKASATSGYEAHGFVLDSVATGDEVAVYTDGYNPYCTDLSPGSQFLSTTPGEPSGTAPSQAGRTVQRLGFASDSTTLHFQPGPPIRLT